jgi:hypothetical protein
MRMEEVIFVVEGMFPGIIGGSDYLLQETVDLDTGSGLGDAKIIKWELPIEQPSQEDMEEFFEQVKEEFYMQKNMGVSNLKTQEDDRRQKIVESYLSNAK